MSKTSVTASAEVPTQHMTVDGIEIDVLEGAISDYDVMEASHDAHAPSLSPADRTRATMRFFRLVLGDSYEPVKRELRARGEGRLPFSAMNDFMAHVVEAMSQPAKN